METADLASQRRHGIGMRFIGFVLVGIRVSYRLPSLDSGFV